MPGFTPDYLFPTVICSGQTHRFAFGNSLSQFQVSNLFQPTTNNSSQNCFELININSSGFRLRHLTSSSDTSGNLIIENFINGNIPGTILATFQQTGIIKLGNNLDLNSFKIINLATPTSATDAANKSYVDSTFLTCVTSAAGTTNQITVSGTGSGPYTGDITISLPNTVVINTSLTAANLSLSGNLLQSTNTNGSITVTPNGTGIVNITKNLGLNTTTPHSSLQFGSVSARMVTLFELANNNFQFTGFGLNGNSFVYSLSQVANNHSFVTGTSSSANKELMRIEGGGNIYVGGSGSLRFFNSAATQYVGFQAPSLSGNTVWTLPTTDSTGTQALVSNGSGVFSWQSLTSGTVTSVSGTANRITVTSPTTTPVIDIASTYVGQTSLTTLGTITTGTWNGSV